MIHECSKISVTKLCLSKKACCKDIANKSIDEMQHLKKGEKKVILIPGHFISRIY